MECSAVKRHSGFFQRLRMTQDTPMAPEAGRVLHDEPLAYFLTWTTYGSWLPGDERGWVAKPGVFLPPDAHLEQASRSLMTEPPLILDSTQRELVENTIADHC